MKATGAVTVGAVGLNFLGADDLFIQTLKPILPKVSGQNDFDEKIVNTTCWIGKQECGMKARVINGRIIKVEGHPDHPRNNGRLCPKGSAQLHGVYDPYRVKAPLRRVNAKGDAGEWQEISWDEATTIVGTKIAEAKARGNGSLVWQKGRSKAGNFYDTAFVKATDSTKLHHGGYCSDAAYRAAEITVGGHGGIHPDFKNTEYLLSYGWSMTTSGGNKMCWLTWPQQFMDARERGMKVTTLDPFRHSMGNHTDAWLPIKPGSDLAFFLALGHQLVANGTIDEPYLKAHTNSGFLVKNDGKYLRVDDKEQVWDATKGRAVDHDAADANPAIDGTYTVGGASVKPAFQVFKEHLEQYSPDWAAEITGISAAKIRQLATELGENAHIGETITIDGVELPYRPVAFMGYHVSQQELGFQV
jgi:anaerobic selenocysteine-containing dehydrogenase